MVVQSGQDYGTAGRTTGSGAKGMGKQGAIVSDLVKIWCFHDRVAIAAHICAMVIRNKEDNVFLSSLTASDGEGDEH